MMKRQDDEAVRKWEEFQRKNRDVQQPGKGPIQ